MLFQLIGHDIYCFQVYSVFIIFKQEVDFFYEWLKDLLDESGYESYFTRKPDCFGSSHTRDGVVIAFKTSRFKYEDYKAIEFPPVEASNEVNIKSGTAGLLVHLSLRNKPSIRIKYN